jgi:diacylglycerol kinase family enzyme
VSATKPAEQHSETTATRRGVLMVNTQARSGADAYASAKKLLQQRGFVLDEFHAVPEPARISGLVGQAVAQGHDLIVGGSDGTISAAGNVLQGKDVTCGILPLGTANSFARGLDLPLDLTAAVDVLVHGRNERGRLLGRFSYPAVASLVLPSFKPFGCVLTLASGERRNLPAALEIRIANTLYEGGVEGAPDASATSGDLVVHIVTGASKWRLVKTWAKIVAGLEPDGPGYARRTPEHRNRAAAVCQSRWRSGDDEPIDVRIARKALRVMVPRWAAAISRVREPLPADHPRISRRAAEIWNAHARTLSGAVAGRPARTACLHSACRRVGRGSIRRAARLELQHLGVGNRLRRRRRRGDLLGFRGLVLNQISKASANCTFRWRLRRRQVTVGAILSPPDAPRGRQHAYGLGACV